MLWVIVILMYVIAILVYGKVNIFQWEKVVMNYKDKSDLDINIEVMGNIDLHECEWFETTCNSIIICSKEMTDNGWAVVR